MGRQESREEAFKFLYQMEFQDTDLKEQKELYVEENLLTGNDLDFFNLLVDGVFSIREDLDNLYSKFLKNWTPSRLPRIDQTILRLSTYEIIHMPDIPVSVSINEAVLLAKKYSSEESRAYINGILGQLSKRYPKQPVGP